MSCSMFFQKIRAYGFFLSHPKRESRGFLLRI